jgi:hypothetical protein
MPELRHTLVVFLTEGRNARRAADLENTFVLELALRLVGHYGDWALTD